MNMGLYITEYIEISRYFLYQNNDSELRVNIGECMFEIKGKRKLTVVTLIEIVVQLLVCLQAWKLSVAGKRDKNYFDMCGVMPSLLEILFTFRSGCMWCYETGLCFRICINAQSSLVLVSHQVAAVSFLLPC